MPSDGRVAVGLVAHYLCPVLVPCVNGSEEEEELVGKPKPGGRMEEGR